jgi:hypothetical protein
VCIKLDIYVFSSAIIQLYYEAHTLISLEPPGETLLKGLKISKGLIRSRNSKNRQYNGQLRKEQKDT